MSRYDYKRKDEMWNYNLHEYLREDISYQRYLKDEDFIPNDFEQYNIDHCLDIEDALKEILKLRARNSNLKNRKKSEGEIVDGE